MFSKLKKIRIPSHVLVYSLLVAIPTAAALGYSASFGKSDEEKRRAILEKHGNAVHQSAERNKQLQEFFNQMKGMKDNDELDKKMHDVLKGGKGDMKRAHELEKPSNSSSTVASNSSNMDSTSTSISGAHGSKKSSSTVEEEKLKQTKTGGSWWTFGLW